MARASRRGGLGVILDCRWVVAEFSLWEYHADVHQKPPLWELNLLSIQLYRI
jgi:hypothetical protein